MTQQTQKERLEFRNKLLDDYEHNLGLPNNMAPGSQEELQEYLVMKRSEIEALTPDLAIAISMRLSQYSYFIQRCQNRERAMVKWADKELEGVVSKELLQHSDLVMKHEAKVALICKENSAAKSLSDISLYAQQRATRLDDLAASLKNISYVVSLVAKNKSGDRR